jgi:hypothetical protein
MKILTFFSILLLVIGFSVKLSAQEIVFAQDYVYKNSAFSKKLMGAYVLEDTITDEKLIILSGGKSVNFYYTDAKWKLIKTFEQTFLKNSAFTSDNFKVIGYHHNENVWDLILQNSETFTAERVDMSKGIYGIAGNVFEDKKPDWTSHNFSDDKSSYCLYPNSKGNFTLVSIDDQLNIKSFPVDLSSQLPIKETRKLDPLIEIFGKLNEIDTLTAQSIVFTHNRVQFYMQSKTFTFLIAFENEPYSEMMVFDKETGKRIKTEIFSTKALLQESAKSEKVNNNALLYNGYLWMITTGKNGGVLAVFDSESKKLLQSITYQENNAPAESVYGPVMYKMLPGGENAKQEFTSVKDKLEEIDMATFCRDMYKEVPSIYIIPISENEYAVNIASYALVYTMAPESSTGGAIRSSTTYNYNPGIYESSAIGFIVTKPDLKFNSKKMGFNEINRTNANNRYIQIKPNYLTSKEQPEYKNSKAYVIKEQIASFKIYTIYYFDNQLKIAAKSTPMDLSKMNTFK